MLPFYDPGKSYEENFEQGPFSAFADKQVFTEAGGPKTPFLGQKVFLPFGIASGPLLNAKFVKAALDKGFDLAVYKTVRTRIYPAHPWPNVLPVETAGDLKPEGMALKAGRDFQSPLSVTNSFGVPSFNPHFWQKDMAEAISYAKPGQVVIGSFQGTVGGVGDIEAYVADFALAARLVKETGVKIFEVNLSCPNEGTEHLLCFDLPRVKLVAEAIKNELGNLPLVIKLAYFYDNEQLIKLIRLVGKDISGVAAINTIPAAIVNGKGKQALPGKGREKSGVGGRAIKWAGLEMVERLKKIREELDLKFTIIGVGGVASPEGYLEYREKGADAVMSATGAMWNSYLAQEIKKAVQRFTKL